MRDKASRFGPQRLICLLISVKHVYVIDTQSVTKSSLEDTKHVKCGRTTPGPCL